MAARDVERSPPCLHVGDIKLGSIKFATTDTLDSKSCEIHGICDSVGKYIVLTAA